MRAITRALLFEIFPFCRESLEYQALRDLHRVITDRILSPLRLPIPPHRRINFLLEKCGHLRGHALKIICLIAVKALNIKHFET